MLICNNFADIVIALSGWQCRFSFFCILLYRSTANSLIMILQLLQKYSGWFHLLAWILYAPLNYVYNIDTVEAVSWWHIIALCFLYAPIFYSVYFSLVFLFNFKYGILWSILAVCLLFFILGLVGYVFIYQFLPLLDIRFFIEGEKFSWPLYFRGILPHYIKFATNACLFFFITRAFLAIQRQGESERLRFDAEREMYRFEQAFLLAQINPHFLHNTLNMLHRQAKGLSADLARGIYKLSSMMRYTLDNAQSGVTLAPLHREVEHLQLLLDIHAARFRDNRKVEFKVEGDLYGHRIPALALITLVENAFKFGDLSDPGNPLIIRLSVDHNRIYFYCRNKKKINAIDRSGTHIGIDNLKRRLESHFKGNFSIWVMNENEFYSVELIINLNDYD